MSPGAIRRQWDVQNGWHQQTFGVESNEPREWHRPLLDDHLRSRRPVLRIRNGKQMLPGCLGHRPGHVEAGSQARESVGSGKSLDAERRDAQIPRLRLQNLQRLVTQLPPDRDRLGPTTFRGVAVVGPTLQAAGLLPQIPQRRANATPRGVGLKVDSAWIVAGKRVTKNAGIELE